MDRDLNEQKSGDNLIKEQENLFFYYSTTLMKKG